MRNSECAMDGSRNGDFGSGIADLKGRLFLSRRGEQSVMRWQSQEEFEQARIAPAGELKITRISAAG